MFEHFKDSILEIVCNKCGNNIRKICTQCKDSGTYAYTSNMIDELENYMVCEREYIEWEKSLGRICNEISY